jgi:acetyltransferase
MLETDRPAPVQHSCRLRDGRTVCVRPIRTSDAGLLREFDGGLCERSRRLRYHALMPLLSLERAVDMATVDFVERFALVATATRDERERLVADCRMFVTGERHSRGELAIAVADEFQDLGLGRTLVRDMLGIAGAHHLSTAIAEVLTENERMIHVLGRLGFRRTDRSRGTITFAVALPVA